MPKLSSSQKYVLRCSARVPDVPQYTVQTRWPRNSARKGMLCSASKRSRSMVRTPKRRPAVPTLGRRGITSIVFQAESAISTAIASAETMAKGR